MIICISAGVCLVSHPDQEDKRVFSCPTCSKQLRTPSEAAKHLVSHKEMLGKLVYFGNVRFQTKSCQVNVCKSTQRKIEQFAEPRAASQPAAKKAKSNQDNSMPPMLNSLLAANAEQRKQITLLLESAKQRDEQFTRLLDQNQASQELSKTLVTALGNSQSLAAAEENNRRLTAFQKGTGTSNT